MEFETYTEKDYLNYDDINYIGECINTIHGKIVNTYHKYAFAPVFMYAVLNMVIKYNDFKAEIQTIQNFKDYYYNFDGFIDLKKYLNWQTINYKEINDMCTDLKIIYDNIDEIGNRNIWNFNYLMNWNEDSNIEWEEI